MHGKIGISKYWLIGIIESTHKIAKTDKVSLLKEQVDTLHQHFTAIVVTVKDLKSVV